MQLHEMMTRNVQTVKPNAPVRDAAKIMKTLDVGFVPVCDGKKVLGTLTDRDIAIRVVAEGMSSQSAILRASTMILA
jgi:CBS domain-containing protein